MTEYINTLVFLFVNVFSFFLHIPVVMMPESLKDKAVNQMSVIYTYKITHQVVNDD